MKNENTFLCNDRTYYFLTKDFRKNLNSSENFIFFCYSQQFQSKVSPDLEMTIKTIRFIFLKKINVICI